MKARNLLTDEQNRDFDAQMLRWQQTLNLMDWRVERIPGVAKGAMASVSTNLSARLATYKTGDWGAGAVTAESIQATALHEMLHVLLADLLAVAGKADDMLESAEHRVVNTLEKLLLKGAP